VLLDQALIREMLGEALHLLLELQLQLLVGASPELLDQPTVLLVAAHQMVT
jgi:hypothetical protein